jgi:hypothetical protein
VWLEVVVRGRAAHAAPGRCSRCGGHPDECADRHAGLNVCLALPTLGAAVKKDGSKDSGRSYPVIVHEVQRGPSLRSLHGLKVIFHPLQMWGTEP